MNGIVNLRFVRDLLTGMLLMIALAFPVMGGEPTIGPPVRIDNGGGTAWANETTMASIDGNPNEVVGGWNDYRSGIKGGFAVSNDGGQTWIDLLVRPPAGHEASVEGDPMTCYDNRTGTLWVGAMSWSGNGGVFVARKNPGENTFQPSVMTIVDGSIDKGWMAAGVDPDNDDATRLYLTYNYGCQYSTDMGDTWTSPNYIASGVGFLPRVGPGGELYVTYWDYDDGVMLKRSFNGGESFEPAIRIATRMDVWDIYSGSRFPGNFRVPSLNALAVDPVSGELYCVYFDTTDISGGNYNVDLYFTSSDDQGSTWTTPVVINSDGTPPGDQFFSWLEVDRSGRLHLVLYDTRHTDQDDGVLHGMFDAYYAYSEDGGANWHEHRLTPEPFDSFDAGGSSQFIGDYLGLGVGGNKVYPCYLSTQNGDPDIFTNLITFEVSGIRVVTGPGPAQDNPPEVRIYPAEQDASSYDSFYPYGPPHYGVNVACGDLDGGGADIITGAGPGRVFGPHVRGFTPDGVPLPGLSFLAYGTNKYGVNVAAGDLDGDGYDEIITGAGPGRVFGPHVRAFDYDGTGTVSSVPGVSYLAYGTNVYGVNVTAGDIDGDGFDEIVTGAGPGAAFGPHVRGWNVDGGPVTAISGISMMAYATRRFGVEVACGDVDGDGIDEIITAPGPSAAFGAHIRGWNYDGIALEPLSGYSLFAWMPAEARHGAKIFAGADLDGDGRDDLLAGPGPDPAVQSPVKAFTYDGAGLAQLFSLTAFPDGWTHGVNVAAGEF